MPPLAWHMRHPRLSQRSGTGWGCCRTGRVLAGRSVGPSGLCCKTGCSHLLPSNVVGLVQLPAWCSHCRGGAPSAAVFPRGGWQLQCLPRGPLFPDPLRGCQGCCSGSAFGGHWPAGQEGELCLGISATCKGRFWCGFEGSLQRRVVAPPLMVLVIALVPLTGFWWWNVGGLDVFGLP